MLKLITLLKIELSQMICYLLKIELQIRYFERKLAHKLKELLNGPSVI
jgi:hypothetical protein